MPVSKNNYSYAYNYESEGVDVTYFTVNFINSMAAETDDLSSGSATAGLDAVRKTIGSYFNVLGEGPLTDSNKQKTYFVRTDGIGSTITANTLRDAIRALNGTGVVTATISSATVTTTNLGILTAAAV
jgi:hypothetical protein